MAYEYDQMRFTILEEIKSTFPKSLFYNYYSQIKSNQIKCWFLIYKYIYKQLSIKGRANNKAGTVECPKPYIPFRILKEFLQVLQFSCLLSKLD